MLWGMDRSRVNNADVEAELFVASEGNMSAIAMRDDAAPPWSMAISRSKSSHRNLGGLALDHKTALVRIGEAMSRSR